MARRDTDSARLTVVIVVLVVAVLVLVGEALHSQKSNER